MRIKKKNYSLQAWWIVVLNVICGAIVIFLLYMLQFVNFLWTNMA